MDLDVFTIERSNISKFDSLLCLSIKQMWTCRSRSLLSHVLQRNSSNVKHVVIYLFTCLRNTGYEAYAVNICCFLFVCLFCFVCVLLFLSLFWMGAWVVVCVCFNKKVNDKTVLYSALRSPPQHFIRLSTWVIEPSNPIRLVTLRKLRSHKRRYGKSFVLTHE